VPIQKLPNKELPTYYYTHKHPAPGQNSGVLYISMLSCQMYMLVDIAWLWSTTLPPFACLPALTWCPMWLTRMCCIVSLIFTHSQTIIIHIERCISPLYCIWSHVKHPIKMLAEVRGCMQKFMVNKKSNIICTYLAID
jgi:hypothetical protein